MFMKKHVVTPHVKIAQKAIGKRQKRFYAKMDAKNRRERRKSNCSLRH